ncbi:hypothetical protein GIB67_028137, partial [Kingdonia uniflora]
MNIPQGSEFKTESAQAALGAQPPVLNVFPNFHVNIPIVGRYSEGEGATSNDNDLNAFNSLKAGGAGNSLSLRKLKEHYAYKLEKVLSDGTAAAAKKKKGLTARSAARAYMLYVLGSFLFPTKKGTYVSARYLFLFVMDKVAKNWSWGSTVLAHMYFNLGTTSRDDGRQFACCTTLLEVVWDPYRDKRDSAHAFKEVTFFYGVLASPDHVQPYYPNKVVRQFNWEQGIPIKQLLTEVSNLWNAKEQRKFNP